MSDEQRGPGCGYRWDGPTVHGRDDFSTTLLESMTREIRYLRETVAQLRGIGRGRSTSTAKQAHQAAPEPASI